MHRTSEPDFIAALRLSQIQWGDLDWQDRRRIRAALAQEFRRICAYCERQCEPQTPSGNPMNREEIEHFRPRSRFPHLSFDWLNLVYSCRRCNQSKADSWPGFEDASINLSLAEEDPRYTPVSEYVSPNASSRQRAATDFFSYDFDTGEIMPSVQLSSVEWSVARRTIRDIDLNDSRLGENDPNHLWRQRRAQLDFLREAANAQEDDELTAMIVQDFMLPDSPFSSFVHAYVTTQNGESPST